jgi:lysophospholipase L1-like esterase
MFFIRGDNNMKKYKIMVLFFLLFLSVQSAFAQSITLVTVGDSLTAGDGDDGIGGGYPARLLSLLQTSNPGSTLSNRAISGDTTTDLVNKQLDNAVADLNTAPAENRKMALVWIGSNDLFGLYNSDVCDEYYGGNLSLCEEVEMGYAKDNVNTILTRLKSTGAELYIALLDDQSRRPVITDPVLRGDSFPGITDAEAERMATQISAYNNNTQSLAAIHRATTVDFFNTVIFESWATLSDDGNHPNGAGYDAITDIWHQAITDNPPPVNGSSIVAPMLLLLD